MEVQSARERSRPLPGGAGIRLTREGMEEYLGKLETAGCAPETLQTYRRSLERLYQFLGEDKYIRAGTLAAWQQDLLGRGYSDKTVNIRTSAANGLMQHLGRRDLQADRLPEEKTVQPELTRSEYLRLLSTARSLGKERTYLLVKLFGATGLPVGDVEQVTAEAVREGWIRLPSETLRIPGGLREELLHYMGDNGITSGPVFRSRQGKPQGRTVVTTMIRSLCQDARVSEEKGNPRCLRKLYQTTRDGIWDSISILADQAYDRLLEKEQRASAGSRHPEVCPCRQKYIPGSVSGS